MLKIRNAGRFLTASCILLSAQGCVSRGLLSRLERQVTHWNPQAQEVQAELSELCLQKTTAACALLGQEVAETQGLGIIQGHTTQQQANLVVQVPEAQRLTYLVSEQAKRLGSAEMVRLIPVAETFRRKKSPWRLDRLQIDGLKVGAEYNLLVVGDRGELIDVRHFQALNLEKKKPRIIVASCLDDGFRAEQSTAWAKVATRQPDVLFLIGDSTYADKYLPDGITIATPELLWKRHSETRQSLELFRWPRLVPVYAVWDDHDFGANDGNRTYPYAKESLAVMQAFFPLPEGGVSWRRGPGDSGMLTAFGQKFAFLDDRSARSPNDLDLVDQTHFGLETEKWLLEELRSNQAPVWLISGDQWFGNYHPFESYEGDHFKSFQGFKRHLRSLTAPVIFLSGDRHLVEIMKIDRRELGYQTYELTTSGIHARTYADSLERNPNPRRIWGASGPYNFMEIVPEVIPAGLRLQVQSWDIEGEKLDQRELLVSRKARVRSHK